MRVLPHLLAKFAPELAKTAPDTLAEHLTNLGFEAEFLAGETPALEVSVTPNRADGMSHLGLARDLRAHFARNRKRPPKTLLVKPTGRLENVPQQTEFTVSVKPKTVASQYHFVLFEHVTIQPSPDWLRKELHLLGIRPINTVVDVTNYLMELYGQPLHAFDADAILGAELNIRLSKQDESLETLDGTTHNLPAGVAVIQDRETLVDLAGIMGGANSEVQPTTTRVLLQSAIFDMKRIRQATNILNHRTGAATRYERGVDPTISISVLEEATRLLSRKEFGKAKAKGRELVISASSKRKAIELDPKRVNVLLGFTVSKQQQKKALTLLGCSTEESKRGFLVTPPSWRYDMTLWQDLAEEIARLTGLDTDVPSRKLPPVERVSTPSTIEWSEGLKDRLVQIGLNEVQTYSFISAADLKVFELPDVGELANPLNPELRFLRPSLVPNMAHVIAGASLFDPITVFEIGHVFGPKSESVNLCIGLAGNTANVKAWIAKLADAIGLDSNALTSVARVTEFDHAIRHHYKIRKSNTLTIECSLDDLTSARRIPKNYHVPSTIHTYQPLSKFPPVSRDIAVIVDRTTDTESIASFVRGLDAHIESVDVFDEFVSDRFGAGKKSVALHIYYADIHKTLTDQEAKLLHDTTAKALQDTFGADIR